MAREEDLIDVSEFEDELSSEALTEIAGSDEEEEEEVTPIRKRPIPLKPEERKTPPPLKGELQNAGTYIATLRERFTAFFIDTLMLFYLYWAGGTLYILWSGKAVPYSGWNAVFYHAAFALFCFLYYLAFEGIFLATMGKFTCWMSVSFKDGQPASLLSIFIRNILRPIDYLLIFPAIFVMDLTKYKQRLGDLISGTTVVKKFASTRKPYEVSAENIASSSGRTIAQIIDTSLFLLFLAGYILLLRTDHPFISQWIIILLPLAVIIYFVTIEMATETSPGKWLFGYIICQEGGGRLTMSGSATRTIWRIFDTNPVGLLSIFLSNRHQRPGDTAAGTIVIKHKRKAKGLFGIAFAVIAAAATLYFGIHNDSSLLSGKFREDFLSKIPILKDLGLATERPVDLRIGNFRFAVNEPENLRVPPMFAAGETVYLLCEINGYKKEGRDVYLQGDIAVRYPDGTIGLDQKNIIDYRKVLTGYGPVGLENPVKLGDSAPPGEYEVIITIRDKYAGSEIKEIQKFYVRRPLVPIK